MLQKGFLNVLIGIIITVITIALGGYVLISRDADRLPIQEEKVATPEIPDQVSPGKTVSIIEEKPHEQPKQPAEEIDLTQQSLDPHLQGQAGQETVASPTTKTCTNTDPVLTADITDFSNVQKITAPGSPSSEGPKGHSFIWTENERVPVYAPVDAVLENGAYYTAGDGATQYILNFRIKNICDFVFRFDHIDETVDSVRNVFPLTPRPTEDTRGEPPTTEISFSAGELIGYTRGTRQAGNWDFGLYNLAKKGALADSYGMHSYSVCWVDFYSSEKQTQYRSLLEGSKLVCSF